MLKKLARDSSIDVVRTVANNEAALLEFPMPLIQEMIARDVSVALAIADNLHYFDVGIVEEVILSLIHHPDPKVVETTTAFDCARD